MAGARAADGPRFEGGELLFPSDYREWIYLSSGLGMTYNPPESTRAAAPRFDNVFVNREAYRQFVAKGVWPDRTILVLEVRASESNGSINRGGHYQSEVTGIEAEVKFGGKWSFYGFNKGAAKAKPIPGGAACYSCHPEHGAVDNTFVQFYPTLLPVAREKGTLRR